MKARDDEREALAQAFHEAYERLAPSHGYETRKASAVPWAEVPEPNRSLMVAVAGELLAAGYRTYPEPEITDEMVERAADAFERTWDAGVEEYDDSAPAAPGDFLRNLMRAVLEAALRVPVSAEGSGEGEQ